MPRRTSNAQYNIQGADGYWYSQREIARLRNNDEWLSMKEALKHNLIAQNNPGVPMQALRAQYDALIEELQIKKYQARERKRNRELEQIPESGPAQPPDQNSNFAVGLGRRRATLVHHVHHVKNTVKGITLSGMPIHDRSMVSMNIKRGSGPKIAVVRYSQ
jgi:hypothetical protein